MSSPLRRDRPHHSCSTFGPGCSLWTCDRRRRMSSKSMTTIRISAKVKDTKLNCAYLATTTVTSTSTESTALVLVTTSVAPTLCRAVAGNVTNLTALCNRQNGNVNERSDGKPCSTLNCCHHPYRQIDHPYHRPGCTHERDDRFVHLDNVSCCLQD